MINLGEIKKARVVDFGCSDGHMIKQLNASFHERIDTIKGVDIFPHGKPESDDENVEYITVDLYREFPFPFQDESQDIMIHSAFFKHHPRPLEMLSECHRILNKGGFVVMLDPSMWVVRVGFILKYFDREYTTNPWSYKSVNKMIIALGLQNEMKIILYEKYWIAPNSFLFKLGIEKIIPNWFIQIFGLHQSIIIRKL